jgi:hypothetical protein
MCYEYTNWAWRARVAELAKKERKLSEPPEKPAPSEVQPDPAVETSPKERDTVAA